MKYSRAYLEIINGSEDIILTRRRRRLMSPDSLRKRLCVAVAAVHWLESKVVFDSPQQAVVGHLIVIPARVDLRSEQQRQDLIPAVIRFPSFVPCHHDEGAL